MRIRSFATVWPWVLVATTSLGGLGVGPLFSVGGRAHAQAIKEAGWPPPEGAACKPSAGDDEEAKTLYKLAEKAENTSNYSDAIKYYKDAYKRACNRHLLLKNLGRAYEKDAQYAAAVEAYKLYRTRGKPTGEELDTIDAKIANLSKKVSTTAEPTSTGTTTAPTTTSTTTTTDTSTTGTSAPTTTAAPTTTSTTSGGGGGPGVLPWVVAGVGGAIFIGGTVVWIGANGTVSDKQDEFELNDCRRPKTGAALTQCQSIKSDGESASSTRTVGAVVAVVGLGVAAGGIIWALTSKKKEPAAASLQITPGPTWAGIGLSGSF